MNKNKKIGLALSGGAALGLAHLGVLKALIESSLLEIYTYFMLHKAFTLVQKYWILLYAFTLTLLTGFYFLATVSSGNLIYWIIFPICYTLVFWYIGILILNPLEKDLVLSKLILKYLLLIESSIVIVIIYFIYDSYNSSDLFSDLAIIIGIFIIFFYSIIFVVPTLLSFFTIRSLLRKKILNQKIEITQD